MLWDDQRMREGEVLQGPRPGAGWLLAAEGEAVESPVPSGDTGTGVRLA